MTDRTTTVRRLRHGPLTADMVPLLTADSAIWTEGYGVQFLDEHRRLLSGNLTYIGERSPDGWIAAPEGGWTSNPVPGRRIEWRCSESDKFKGEHLSDDLGWPAPAPVVAFRLAFRNTTGAA